MKVEGTQKRALRSFGFEGVVLIEKREESEMDERLELLVRSWPPLSAVPLVPLVPPILRIVPYLITSWQASFSSNFGYRIPRDAGTQPTGVLVVVMMQEVVFVFNYMS